MKNVVRAALVVLSIAMPALAGPGPSSAGMAPTTTEARADRDVIATSPASVRTTTELEQRVRALEAELTELRAQQLERRQVLSDQVLPPNWLGAE